MDPMGPEELEDPEQVSFEPSYLPCGCLCGPVLPTSVSQNVSGM